MPTPAAPAPRELFAGLVDDAAMFPPGNASASEALALHLTYRKAWFRDLIGPLLVPARAWPEFVDAHRQAGAPSIAVVVIGPAEEPQPLPDGVTVVGFELPVDAPPLPETGERSLAAEVRAGDTSDEVLAAVASQAAEGRPVVAKFRTGGVTADAFPDEHTVAEVLDRAFRAGAPLKLTAGLHHAVRFTAADTGFEHHGFLNVLAATSRWLGGAAVDQMAQVIGERDGAVLAGEVAGLSAAAAVEVRQRFVSFGCCGVTDPVDDLVSLGLLEGSR